MKPRINKLIKLFILTLVFFFTFSTLTEASTRLPIGNVVTKHYKLTAPFGISVLDYDTGEVVYSYNANKERSPASNLKLLTGAAALDLLGSNYQFKTQLYYDGTIKDGTLNGNLHIVGSGDPTLLPKDINTLAWMTRKLGIKRITGYIYADTTKFSGSSLSPGVVPHEEHLYYGARVTPLTMSPTTTYNSGTIQVHVSATKIGAAPKVTGTPSLGGMVVVNKAKTGSKSSRNTISISRPSGTNKIVISGTIPSSGKQSAVLTSANPTYTTLNALLEALKSRGTTFDKKYVVATKSLPKKAKLIGTHKSMKLGSMYKIFMKQSNNPMGDIFVKTIGYELYGKGDFETGIKAIKEYGNSIGLQMDKWTLVDGSGLSKNNKVPPAEMAKLLYVLQDKPYYEQFYGGLLVGGHPDPAISGSLKNRFKDQYTYGRVHAKTGHITGVYTLTGITTGYYTNKKYIFSIMSENYGGTIGGMDQVIRSIILLK